MENLSIMYALGGVTKMKNSSAILIGVGIGVVVSVIGVGCYFCYRKKMSDKKNKEMMDRNTNELLNKKEMLEMLNASEIVEWFKENVEADELNCVVARPTEKVLEGLGCNPDKSVYGEKTLIQMIYDTENKQANKIRLIIYENIDTNFETQIDENDGFLVVSL